MRCRGTQEAARRRCLIILLVQSSPLVDLQPVLSLAKMFEVSDAPKTPWHRISVNAGYCHTRHGSDSI